MCDTLIALGNATADGSVILAKNSDRAPNEAQYPLYVPRALHSEATVRCTHIKIPQVQETFGVLLSRPFWIWGCEMGVNEHGVSIGNEAVFTKEPLAETGLLGMDLIRLALERAETARGALEVIVQLLEAHGQGGACNIHGKKGSYHNSFIIADPGQAWVLETAGRYWAAVQVHDVYSISNRLTIGADWDLSSPELVEHAVERGWCTHEGDFHFSRCYSDLSHATTRSCASREQATRTHLRSNRGQHTVADMFAYLRDHGQSKGGAPWRPDQSQPTVCMHAAGGGRSGQSTASLVAHLRADMPAYWMTGTSAPCTGVFKPFYVGPLPDGIGASTDRYNPDTMWWAHERLHRAVLWDHASRLSSYQDERDELEATFLREEQTLYHRLYDTPSGERAAMQAELTRSTCARTAEATVRWERRVKAMPVQRRPRFLYRLYWRRRNRMARFPTRAAT
jgi:secernin